MRALLLVAAAVAFSACGTTSGPPNGWGAGPAPRSETERTPPRRVAPTPRAEARPPAEARSERRAASASGLMIPVVGVEGSQLRDSFLAPRSGGRTHHAIDIAAPTGTPLVAVTDGLISRKHWNRLGGRTLYLTSADGRYDYYYAHLHTYADGIEIGTQVRRGDVLGTVGATGNARGAHLHFQVLDKRGPGRGTPVNPYDLLRGAESATGEVAD